MDSKSRITVASMGRTGSHLLVEVVKTQFKHVKHIHYFSEEVLKSSDKIISGKRDFREQMASTKRFLTKVQGEPYTSIIENDGSFKGRRRTLEQECHMAIQIYYDWLPHTSDVLPLELWFTNPREYIVRVYNALGVPESNYNDSMINGIIKSLQKPIKPGHITKTPELKNYDKTFNEDEVNTILKFFDEHYKTDKDKFIYLESYL